MLRLPALQQLLNKNVVLASGSPRRREILTNMGLHFKVVPSSFPETLDKTAFVRPQDYVMENSRQKAAEVFNRLQALESTPDLVIGADTVVVIDGRILEKPVDRNDAVKMLGLLNNRSHDVYTAVALVTRSDAGYDEYEVGRDGSVKVFVERTRVQFCCMTDEMINAYVNSGEPMDKAGGYGQDI